MEKKQRLILLFIKAFSITFLSIAFLAGVFLLASRILPSKMSEGNSETGVQKETADAETAQAVLEQENVGMASSALGESGEAAHTRLPGAGVNKAGAADALSNVEEAERGLSGEASKQETSYEDDTEQREAEDTKVSRHATLVFAGDICFHDPFSNMNSLRSRGGRMQDVIARELLEEMTGADICMANNEFCYSDRGEPLADKMYTFRSKPGNVKLLSEMGIDIVGIANNHAYDYGEQAFLDTLDVLDQAGVARVGGGRNLDEASKPCFFEIDGIKIAYLAATQIERNASPDTRGATSERAGVLRCFSDKELEHFLKLIQKTKEECDFLVVYIHWGTESTDVLDWAQPYQADLISKAGADVIVGCHPHVLQGMDCVNGVPVFYSLGNYWFNSKTMDTMLLKLELDENGLKGATILPARQSNCTTGALHDSQKERLLNYLQSLSPNVRIDADGTVDWKNG